MRYWVYGVDGSTKAPRDPLFLEADTEEAVRKQAAEMGMQVDEIEVVEPHSVPAVSQEGVSPSSGIPQSTVELRSAPTVSEEAGVVARFLQSDQPLARLLVVVLRVLAVIAAIWGMMNTANAIDAAGAVEARLKAMQNSSERFSTASSTEAAEIASSARYAAGIAVFSAMVYGVALVAVLLALAEGLRLAIIITRNTGGAAAPFSPHKSKRHKR